jgi:glycosyltransferase involved in cell wall biosynthesis
VRIAWFTPFSPRSAIGHYSEVIVDHLARQHRVTLFVPSDDGDEAPRPTAHPLVVIPDLPTDAIVGALDRFDAVVYNMGNFPRYHLAVYETAVRHPGVVVLHDLVMRDFFIALTRDLLGRPDLFPALLRYAHGPEAEAHGRDVLAGRAAEWEDPRRLAYPLFLPTLRGAVGAVVHSAYAFGRVRELTPLPLARLDFPLFGPARQLAAAPVHPPRPADAPVRVLTFGVVNGNKLIHTTIDAIARSPLLRDRVRFEVIGGGDKRYAAKLEEQVRRHRLDGVVTLAGWQPDDRLQAALAGSDVVVNLRNPHTGESSASLLDALVAGVPTVVWDHGFYAEFPDDVVVKVKAEAELRPALERLVGDADLRTRMGRAAREHAVRRFDTAAYCDGLVAFLEEAFTAAPLSRLADRAGDVLTELGCTPEDEAARRVGREIARWAGG